MEGLTVHSSAGGRVIFHAPGDPYPDGRSRYVRIELQDEGLQASAPVRLGVTAAGGVDLAQFVESLAADRTGWTGIREWRSRDGDLHLDARHDGRGHVTVGLTIRHPDGATDTAWCARVVLAVDTGEELCRFAADLRDLLGR